MKRVLSVLGIVLATLLLLFVGYVAWVLYPQDNPLTLPPSLVASTSVEGVARLENARAVADYRRLTDSYQAQNLASFCGVATGASVLGALGSETSQGEFFSSEASKVRSRFQVTFGGMSLDDLAGLLQAHGLKVSVSHADQFNVDEFRAVVEKNLETADDYLIVNYQREVLGQGRVGHISPISAYDRGSDSVLIMDTAAHKYPPTWVPVEMLYSAMNTKDTASGKLRGFLQVAR